MRYSLSKGIKTHTGKYSILQGIRPQTDMNRLAAAIAVVLIITVLAFGLGLQRIYQPIFPSGKAQISGKDQGGKGAGVPAGNDSSDNQDDNRNENNPGASGAQDTAAAPAAGGGGTAGTAPAGGSGAGSAAAGSTPIIGGRGGGTTSYTPAAPSTSTPTLSAPTPTTSPAPAPTAPSTGTVTGVVDDCLCGTVDGVTNTVQGVTNQQGLPQTPLTPN